MVAADVRSGFWREEHFRLVTSAATAFATILELTLGDGVFHPPYHAAGIIPCPCEPTPLQSIGGLPRPPSAMPGCGGQKCSARRRPDVPSANCARHRWR